MQHDARRTPPVARTNGSRGGPRGSDTVEINTKNVAREMRLASFAHAATSPAPARVEARTPVLATPAVTPRDKARLERLVAGRVADLREAPRLVRDSNAQAPAKPAAPAQPTAINAEHATDARFRFAGSVLRELEGGKAAILRPERRERLIDQAGRDGILPFDANLVIALVQDSARRGDLVTPGAIQTPGQGAEPYESGVRAYLMAVVSSMRVAALLPLVRVDDGPRAARPGSATAFAQASVAVVLAALLLVGMIATLGT